MKTNKIKLMLAALFLIPSLGAAGNLSSGGVRGPILSCNWKRLGTSDFYNVAVFDTGDSRPEFKYLLEISAHENGAPAEVVGYVKPLPAGQGFEGFRAGQLRTEIYRRPDGHITALLLNGTAVPFSDGLIRYVACNGSDISR